ncbi:MAG: ABC transporter ATP-binding protein [Acutalibacteraceae bacterium]
MENAIVTTNLTKVYKNKKAVDSLNLEIRQGEFFALLGVNGAGKTTTIKMLSCLTKPTDGSAVILGNDIYTDAQKIKGCIGVSPQETALAMNLTVKENLEFMAGIYGMTAQEAKQKANEMIEKFHFEEYVSKKAKTLSGGWQRRLSIAMAMISNPQIIFLDEPTLGLDILARRDLWKTIETLKGKVTVILTTHYLEEAEALSDRIAIMKDGKLKAIGSAEELKAKTNCQSFEDAFVSLVENEEI